MRKSSYCVEFCMCLCVDLCIRCVFVFFNIRSSSSLAIRLVLFVFHLNMHNVYFCVTFFCISSYYVCVCCAVKRRLNR